MHAWPHTPRMIVSISRNCWYLFTKKIQLIVHVFLEILQMILQTYFEYFEHAWLRTPEVVLSTCRKPSCLSASKKSTSFSTFFLEILQRYANFLFWVLWICLLRTSIFTCMPKINLIIHFFFESNLNSQQHFDP